MLAALAGLSAFAAAAHGDVDAIAPEPTGEISLTSNGSVTFGSGGVTASCPVTLSGDLDEELVLAVRGETGGDVDAVEIASEECSGVGVLSEALLEAPWAVTYESASGTFPDELTELLLVLERTKWSGTVLGSRCLYEGSLGASFALSGEDPFTVGTIEVLGEEALTRVSGGAFCPATLSVTGSFSLATETAVGGRRYSNSPTFIDYGEVMVSGSSTRSTTLRNLNDAPLSVTRVDIEGSTEVFSFATGAFNMNQQSQSNFNIRFEPRARLGYIATIRFYAGTRVVFMVDVIGSGM